MEAVFFRFLARELSRVLTGSRVEKIFLPSPNVITLALYLPTGAAALGYDGKKTLYLHARYGTGRFFLFLSALKTAQPDRAPTPAMRLRKYLRGVRVAGVVADWPHRRLTLVMAGEAPALILDPRRFPTLADTALQAPDADGSNVRWPPLAEALGDPDIWQAAAQLSPELRRRLSALPRETAETVYKQLIDGLPDGFYVEYAKDMPQAVWPLTWPGAAARGVTVCRFPTALAAATAFGEPLAFGEVTGREAGPETAAKKAGQRRLTRALAKLSADETRMQAFITRRVEADLLAANLHALDKQAKIPRLFLPVADEARQELILDPSLTVVQNMQKLYHLAAKGERGLAAIAKRRGDLQDAKKYLQGRERLAGTQPPDCRTTPGTFKGVAAHVYRTSDGFMALRGKNAKANDQLLRLASPFDLWFHVADGPGAHVILRRDHPGREVPRQSLVEAAGLAILASYASGAAAAEVLVARVADVRRIKGAPTGQVSVGAVLETIRTNADPALEHLREPA